MKTIIFSILLFSQSLFAVNYQVGDIIFIKSQTQQSAALREATLSDWTHVGVFVGSDTIAHANGGISRWSFKKFISGSKNKDFAVIRPKAYSQSLNKTLLKAIEKYEKPYDIWFEWSDSRQYCSEFIYKLMKEVTGVGIGKLETFGDMELNGPYVKELIKKRYAAIGKPLDLNETIVTPVSQLFDSENSDLLIIEGREYSKFTKPVLKKKKVSKIDVE